MLQPFLIGKFLVLVLVRVRVRIPRLTWRLTFQGEHIKCSHYEITRGVGIDWSTT